MTLKHLLAASLAAMSLAGALAIPTTANAQAIIVRTGPPHRYWHHRHWHRPPPPPPHRHYWHR